jgi:hypothetical protein
VNSHHSQLQLTVSAWLNAHSTMTASTKHSKHTNPIAMISVALISSTPDSRNIRYKFMLTKMTFNPFGIHAVESHYVFISAIWAIHGQLDHSLHRLNRAC